MAKLDRAWSDFLDSRRIYFIKLFTVGQRIAGRSNLPCRTNRETRVIYMLHRVSKW